MRILNAAQMREADRSTIEEIGISSTVLMENAGRQVVSAIESSYGDLLDGRVAVLCGHGNNGGDGFVVAALAAAGGLQVYLMMLGDPKTSDAKREHQSPDSRIVWQAPVWLLALDYSLHLHC